MRLMTPIPRALEGLLSAWRANPEIAENIVAWHATPPKPADFAPLPGDLHPALAAALAESGIQQLYTHQAESWQIAHAGKSLVIVTGTASGKTLCYNLPVLDRLARDDKARALYLFPTKALAQDQHKALEGLVAAMARSAGKSLAPIRASAYDGDTPSGHRPAIRAGSRLVITNPDMLHTGVLPHHTLWAELFRNLQFVVIDEMHTYRGVFGSHVANVLRRLRRIAAFYGAHPQFILTSATIANPLQLGEKLVETKLWLVEHDGAPHGARHFLLYNPPVVNKELGIRKSSLTESVKLASELQKRHIQTILFGRSRRTVEILLNYLRQNASREEGNPDQVRGYRSGYLPGERREIERGLREGQIRAVVATNALELGIDIGGMDASLLVGYPGSIAAAIQQAGRAGRKTSTSLSILVATADPLDQFLAHNPEYFFERSPEGALINPDNLLILLQHLRCAAFELPFKRGEAFGNVDPAEIYQFLKVLAESGELHEAGERFFWMADQYPADKVSLRSASPQSVLLQAESEDGPHTIGEVDLESATWLTHPQAVYLHDGQSYMVEDLDLDQSIAHLKRAELDYFTEPRRETTVELSSLAAEAPAAGCTKAYGDLVVTTQTVGFRKVRWYSHEYLGGGEVSLPPSQLHTTGYWLVVSDATVEHLRGLNLWSNDPNDYGPNWQAQRERARARDGYRCQICGVLEAGRQHHVHHKIPFRTFPSYLQANVLENLVTLCPNCHRIAETAVRMRSGLAGLSHVLGELAPLFLMCDSRDIGVHSDPQSSIADGKPVVVVYDEVPAGIGFSERLFEIHDQLVERSLQLVSECECADGCPSCVGPAGESGEGGKKETIALLEALAGK
jgi:DEAD/DEAH box helicase domain-containing protein